MSLTQPTVTRKKQIAWQNVDDKIVLVSPKERRIHVLMGSGGSLWDYLKEPRKVEDLVNMLCEEFDVDEEQASRDVDEFLTQLESEGLITKEI